MIAAISYWSFEHGLSNEHPIRDAAAQARQAGFQGIELAIAETGVLSVASSQADLRQDSANASTRSACRWIRSPPE